MAAALALVLALQAIPAAAGAAPEAANPLSSLRLEIGSSDDGDEQALEIELTPEGVTGPRVVVKRTLPPAPHSEVIRIDDLRPGPYRLVLSGPSLALERRRVEVPARGLATLDLIRLAPGVSLAGRLTDPSGNPVPRVSVLMFGSEGGTVSGATAAEGTFLLQGLKAGGSYHYFLRDDSHFQVEGEWRGEARLDRTMMEATLLSGLVVDVNGEPVAGARLGFGRVSQRSSGGGGSPYTTGPDGRFSARVPSPDTNRLSLTADGFLSYERAISQEKDGSVASAIDLGTLRLERGRSVRGRVLDAGTGLPVADAWLTFLEARDPKVFRLQLPQDPVRSAADGAFELRAIPRDTDVKLLVEKEGFARRIQALSQNETESVEVGLTKGGKVAVTVCGSPAEIARSVVDVEVPGTPTAILNRPLDSDGRHLFENVTPGRVRVMRSWRIEEGVVSAAAFDARTEVEVVEGGTSRAEIACGPLPVAGTVYVGGKPAAGVVVSVTAGRTGRGVSALTDSAGRFQVRVDAPGTYSASGASFRLVSRETCAVPEGGRSDCTFELRAPAPR